MTGEPEARWPARLNLVPPKRRAKTGKLIGVTSAGPKRLVGISLPDARHHTHMPGPTGLGKTELMCNLGVQEAIAGRGLAVGDLGAKGDLTARLLDRLPADCGDRLVLIDTADLASLPAINLVDPAGHGGSPHHVAAHLSTVMGRVWRQWWGPRLAEIAHYSILTLAATPGATLTDTPLLMSDPDWRAGVVAAACKRLGRIDARPLREFWADYDTYPAGIAAPLLSRLRLIFTHPLAARLFGAPVTTFRFEDILDGGILLVRLPPGGDLGDSGAQLIASLILAGLWRAATARYRVPEHARRDATIMLDEAQHALHLPVAVEDALAEARGLHVSLVLAHQYLGQLPKATYQAINANARNKIYFALDPGDAADQAEHVAPWFSKEDLIRLGRHEVILRPIVDSAAAPALTAHTLPATPAIPRRAELLRKTARARTALPERDRRRLLTGSAFKRPALPPDADPGAAEVTPDPPPADDDPFKEPPEP